MKQGRSGRHPAETRAIAVLRVVGSERSTWYEAVSRPPSARALRDGHLRPHIRQVFEDSGATYGPRRVWRALNDGGIAVARCTVERLMTDMELHSTLGRGKSPSRI